MLFTVVIEDQADAGFRAIAPDLDDCAVSDPDPGNALARVRLLVEGTLADLLLAGQPVPSPAPAGAWRRDPRFARGRFYEVHMNLDHLRAVARHQQQPPARRD